MGFPGVSDNEDEQTRLLRQLVALNGGDPDGGDTVTNNNTVNETVNNTVNETVNKTINISEPDESNTSDYFSSGKAPIKVTDETYGNPMEFGFLARTVNVRTTDDIIIRFTKPSGRSEAKDIYVSKDASPFTIGGANGIDTAFLWVKKAPSANNDPEIRVIAYK